MIRYRKPRAHIGSNDPEQLERWAKEFPDCNWGTEIDRSCITVVDLTRGTRPPATYGLRPVIVTATIGGRRMDVLSAAFVHGRSQSRDP